jgi:macrolide transport system ATP-binding/permease protein
MSWKRSLAKLGGFFGRNRQDEELSEEVREHLEMEEQENRESGMSPEEAHFAALRKFGNVVQTQEDSREMWRWTWLETWVQDIRFAFRMLVRNRSFTVVAVLSLAIGIGVNSALFSLADALVLRPLSVSHPGEVVTVVSKSPSDSMGDISYPDYKDFRDRSKTMDGLVAFTLTDFGFAAKPGELPQMKTGMLVSGNLFSSMGVDPELGRGFRPEEDEVLGRDAVVVLGHDFWVTQLGADRSIIGKTVRVNGIDLTVIGVAPERFTGMDQMLRPNLYVPLMMAPRLDANPARKMLENRGDRGLGVKGRLKPGVSLAQAQAELVTIARGLEQAYPATNKDQSITVMTELQARVTRDPPDSGLVAMLMALSAIVLLVACANLANLQLSRARARTREIAIRLAVGAGRMRLVRQLMAESLVVALAGGAVSLIFADAGIRFLSCIQVPTDLPLVLSIKLDQRALLFGLAVSLLSSVLFGLAPALQASRTDLVSSLKSADADNSGRQRLWGRKALVVAQVALSLVLMAVATMLFHGFHSMLAGGPGFRTDHLVMMSFDPGLVRFNDQQVQQFYKQLGERARSTPGVKSAALARVIPMAPNQHTENIVPEGFQFTKDRTSETVFANIVDNGFFETMAVPLVRGRSFSGGDQANAPLVAVVNDELAQHYWPNQDAIGKRFRLNDSKGPWAEIVGIAKTGKYLWVGEGPTPFLYLPVAQHPQPRLTLVAESIGDAASLVAPLREMVRGLDPNQPVYGVRTMSDFYQMRAVSVPLMINEMVGAMGLIGLLLAMVGLYGLMAYTVSRRTREIGIRMAIGADQGSVVRMFMRQGLNLALIGLAIGLVASFAAETGVNAVFSTTKRDPLAYLIVAPALLAVTMLAAWVPARRASRVDPTRALRFE